MCVNCICGQFCNHSGNKRFLVLSMFRFSVVLNFLLLIFVRAKYRVLLCCAVRCIVSEAKREKHIYVYLYSCISLYWKLKTLNEPTFLIWSVDYVCHVPFSLVYVVIYFSSSFFLCRKLSSNNIQHITANVFSPLRSLIFLYALKLFEWFNWIYILISLLQLFLTTKKLS